MPEYDKASTVVHRMVQDAGLSLCAGWNEQRSYGAYVVGL
jgi:hypothetical protein